MKPNVQFFVVVAPGVDPASVEFEPEFTLLDFKFGTREPGELIDQVKEVQEHMAALEKWAEAAKVVLKQKLDKPTAENPELVTPGKRFEAHYVRTVRVDVDREKVKAHFGEEVYARDYCKHGEVFMLKFKPITQTPGTAG